jgi:hypothetical protein
MRILEGTGYFKPEKGFHGDNPVDNSWISVVKFGENLWAKYAQSGV